MSKEKDKTFHRRQVRFEIRMVDFFVISFLSGWKQAGIPQKDLSYLFSICHNDPRPSRNTKNSEVKAHIPRSTDVDSLHNSPAITTYTSGSWSTIRLQANAWLYQSRPIPPKSLSFRNALCHAHYPGVNTSTSDPDLWHERIALCHAHYPGVNTSTWDPDLWHENPQNVRFDVQGNQFNFEWM